ncbi:hypothetical protein MPF19_18890, partial [Polaribacter sp. Z014]|uniref:hypothetical protein n=1 Tax=Polaribacter sp. Z014 TaxID=2927126 RepID=UPI002020653B
MALPHENPWTSEWYGAKRANKIKLKLACLSKEVPKPIVYDLSGCLEKGKWLSNAIEHLEGINYKFDYKNRGRFSEIPRTLKNRIKTKWVFIKHGLKGSYWNLAGR